MKALLVGLWAALCIFVSAIGVIPAALAQDGQVVREVVIEGVQRIEPGTVRSYLLIQEGDPFNADRIDRSLKSLYATGLFSDVTIRQSGDTAGGGRRREPDHQSGRLRG